MEMKNGMNSEEPFEFRVYRKLELAMQYFPDSSKETATRNLRRWIQRCEPLVEALNARDRGGRQNKYYRKWEVELIVMYLGEP